MTETLVGPGKYIERDRWGRPLIIPPGGGRPEPYTRCTTYISALKDKEALVKWRARLVAAGMAKRPDLVIEAKRLDPETDKQRLARISDEAFETAGGSLAANVGTMIHEYTERLDRGELPPDCGEWQPDVDAYEQQLQIHGIEPVEIETFVVHDALKVAGTFDRVYKYNGQLFIGDLKTSKTLAYAAGEYAMQLAVYANSQYYDHETGARRPLAVNTNKAILVHLPAGTGTCTLHWLDINRGWESVGLATAVRDWRKLKQHEWLNPFATPVIEQINQAATVEDLTAIWSANRANWTDTLTKAAATRKLALTTG